MANKLDKLIPVFNNSMQEISRELIGIIPACRRDMRADQIAKGQTLRVPLTPDGENEDIIIGKAPDLAGDEFGNIDVQMTKFRIGKPIVWNGEEELAIGDLRRQLFQDQVTQRMRRLANEMEEDVCLEAAIGAQGGVYGTAGTTPFASSDMKDFAQVIKIMNDGGMPQFGRNMVLNTSSASNLRNHGVLFKVNEAGTQELLRQGVLGRLYGFDIRESGGFRTFAPTGSGYAVNGDFVKGDKKIMVDTGTGAIKKGSVVSFAGNTTKYIVTEDFEGTAGYLNIAPGLVAPVATGVAMTVSNSFLPNVAFTSDAVLLATRTPAMPEGGDNAQDVTTVTDPVSGLTFQVAAYGGHRQRWIEIGAVWGTKTVNPQHSVLLLG